MGKKPSVPTYNVGDAIKEQNRLNQAAGLQQYANVNSPLGGYAISVDPQTGKLTINKNLSDNSLMAQQQQLNTLAAYNIDPTNAEQAYYDAQMAYLAPQLQRQVARTESGLTNRGIALGSNAWNEATGDMYDAQNQTLAGLANNALGAGQTFQQNTLGNAATLGGQIYDPSMVTGAGGAGLYDTYDKKYQNQVDLYKTNMARYNARQQAWTQALNPLGSMSGSMLGGSNWFGDNGNTTSNGNYITDINGNIIGTAGGYGIYNG